MVKLAVSVLIAAALASSALAQDFQSTEDFNARDIVAPSAEQDLFGRAAVKVINNLFSREELSDMLGRDVEVEGLSRRELDELVQREIEFDEALAARQDGDDAGDNGAPPAAPIPSATASATPKPSPSPATPETPKHTTLWSRLIKAFTTVFNPDPKAPAAAKPSAKGTPKSQQAPPAANGSNPPPAANTHAPKPKGDAPTSDGSDADPQEGREVAFEEPIERSLDYAQELEELVARFYELEAEEVEAREFFDEELEERDFFDEEFEERDFDEEMEERDYESVWDELD